MSTEHRVMPDPGLLPKNSSVTPFEQDPGATNSQESEPEHEVIEISSDDDEGEMGETELRSSSEVPYIHVNRPSHRTIADDEDQNEADSEDEYDADYIEEAVVSVLDQDEPEEILDEEDDEDVVVISSTSNRPISPQEVRQRAQEQHQNLRRRAHGGEGGRNMRRRIADEDIQIVNERRIPHRPITRSGEESFRRHILRQMIGRLEVPFGNVQGNNDLEADIEAIRRLDEGLVRERQIEEHISSLLTRGSLRDYSLTFLQGILGPAHEQQDGDEIEASILARIERDNENRVDNRLQSENIFNRKAFQDKKDIADQELEGYTNDISESITPACELCGVVLGEGLPEDFKPNVQYDKELSKYQELYGVPAPWFCFKQVTQVDIDLSKRVFAATRCGHVYCGRCFKNIGSRARISRKKSGLVSIENPKTYSPRTCVAEGCGCTFRGKTPFTEVFF